MATPPATAPSRVARLTSPAEIVAVVPLLVGFEPTESLVAISLRAPRRTVGLTLRCDLPPDGEQEAVARLVLDRLARDGARESVVLIYTAEPDHDGRRAGQSLVDALLARRGTGLPPGAPVREALLVRDDRWWSYLCRRTCCPEQGTPRSGQHSSAVGLVAAQSALQGRGVLASRSELVDSLRPQLPAEELRQLLARTSGRPTPGPERERRAASVAALRAHLAACAAGGELAAGDAARCAVALADTGVRDEVATWALDRPDELLALLIQVARCSAAPFDAPVCTVLAWVAYCRGDGALVNVALERALATDASYPLAQLLGAALDAQLSPDDVRGLLRATRQALSAAGQSD